MKENINGNFEKPKSPEKLNAYCKVFENFPKKF